MSDEEYQAMEQYQSDHIGSVVVFLDNGEERLLLSPHRYAAEHDSVVEAALWVRDHQPTGVSKYKTYIRRELDNGRPGHGSIVNDSSYADSYREAVEWIEQKAQEFGGSILNWDSRKRVVVSSERFEVDDAE